MTTSSLPAIAPADVHAVLARHILADGHDIVFDFEKSHGAWVHDSRTGREYLDFCTFFASSPIGYNHPEMHERLLAGGLLLLTCGVRSIRFRPPLNLTATEADTALEIVRKSLKEL
jgi:4-aminobutyrate aminotransferase-like enzyme